MNFIGFHFGSTKESSVVFVRNDVVLKNVFIEEMERTLKVFRYITK